ncbi:MAG: Crp/Fnr family transcriptional regulator [Clostridia bacterium]|nr:Crp/Fnr family transcriptional regulator [Clostridia bacterium]
MPNTALRRFHLWQDLPDALWTRLCDGMTTAEFASGETVFPHTQTDGCLCVLLQGRAKVYANAPDTVEAALLRTMDAGAIFGVHCIFGNDMTPQSRIVAQKPCCVLLVPSSLWEEILAAHPATMANYVRFLTQRIQFLNRKIRYLTAGSAERRLALYLLSEITEDGVPTRIDLSAVSLADLLDLGRASLYRAMDRLTEDGFLIRDGHEYTLLRRDELLSHYQ